MIFGLVEESHATLSAEGHGSGRDDEMMEFTARTARITACYTADDDARVPVIVVISR